MMKKTLCALAVASLAAGAQAQSALTIFGVVDVGVTYGTGSTSDRTQVTSSNNLASRIGFRGEEALGNGLYATFWLEGSVANDSGTGAATTTNNQSTGTGTSNPGTQGLMFNRRSTVSLGSKTF